MSGEFLTIPADSWTALLAMAGVTYLTRVAGFFLMGRVRLTARVERWLSALPGCMLVALVAPVVLSGGVAEAVSGALVLAVSWRTRSLPAAMVAGVASIWLLRRLVA
ncbi:MAG: AzlD domain-containing protein [Desulfovibrionaceae bacterium]|jgi:uncharacterized membrane protein|nr:AzlD domain-containing protein [Desulfovibrionaceae bacterium]